MKKENRELTEQMIWRRTLAKEAMRGAIENVDVDICHQHGRDVIASVAWLMADTMIAKEFENEK